MEPVRRHPAFPTLGAKHAFIIWQKGDVAFRSALLLNVLQNYFEARDEHIDSRKHLCAQVKFKRALHKIRLLRVRNAAKSFATDSS
jgi:hypothetical protein